MRHRLLLAASLLFASPIAAQPADTAHAPPIQDNSFLIEEAYNQEAGVVQHITTFQLRRHSSDLDAAFTQEWPFRSIRHQLSYDVPYTRVDGSGGIGDIGINYRYQLTGDGDARLAIAPRLSVTLPTGDWKRARGNGGLGFEINIPVSYVVSPYLVTHLNAGGAVTPSARNQVGDQARTAELGIGQSVIVTASNAIQPMLEVIYSRREEVESDDRTVADESFFISPGVRAALNFRSGLQIVPGVAFPIGAGLSRGQRGVFFYLSFEHMFGK
ncbi:MAG TPA: hypothetical protein VHM24_05225 [Gemmatimonadaceae bacterium]|nr:hypothetical protein [Gemmatimonadaceae bacterium]